MVRTLELRLAAILLLLWLPALDASAQLDVEAGRRSYEICAGCHGFVAEGSRLVHAPRLAGLEDWYLERQLRNFARGIRGSAEGDVHGARMAPMALAAVRSDRTLDDLVAYIGTLPDGRSASRRASGPTGAAGTTLAPAGDAGRGRSLYAACAACHGPDAEGNEATASPGLAHLDDWYVVEQLRLFAEGLRGASPNDVYGAQMRAMASTVADEQSRLDIAAYLATLSAQ